MYKYVESFQYAKFDSNHLGCMEGQFSREGKYGYVLVNDHLVPFSFISRLKDELEDVFFEYNEVHPLDDSFSDEFLASLDSVERKVLGACMLLLIEEGDFSVVSSDGVAA
jgi:hypothetical protein